MIQSDVCPVTKQPLDANSIRKPGRLVSNFLGELLRYCPYKSEGCDWTGKNQNCSAHAKGATPAPYLRLSPKEQSHASTLTNKQFEIFFPSLWYSILKDCSFKPREDLVKELQRRDAMMERLTRKNEGLVQRVSKLEQVCPYVFLSPFTFLPCRLSIWATIPYTYFGFPWSGTAN
jgi:hypothetical protein